MTPEQRAHRDQRITEFRYQLVAELANPYLSAAERRKLIQQKLRYDTRCRSSRRAAHPATRRSHHRHSLQLRAVPAGALGRPAALRPPAEGTRRAEPEVRVLRSAGMCSGRLNVRATPGATQRSAPSHSASGLPRRRHPPGSLRRLGIQRVRSRLRSRHPSHPGRSWPHRSPVLRPGLTLRQIIAVLGVTSGIGNSRVIRSAVPSSSTQSGSSTFPSIPTSSFPFACDAIGSRRLPSSTRTR